MRSVRDYAIRNGNRVRGREFIPDPRDILCIETSSMCNLKCRFCAYFNKKVPKVNMPDRFFFDGIEQATDMGFRRFQLTPCTGDVFMDRDLFNKLDFLEVHPQVESCEFFTNFTILEENEIDRLVRLSKFSSLTVSI